MIVFNNIRPEMLGCVKVISVSDHFVAPLEQQTVKRYGNVVASISIPTVRVIEAEFLVRAKKLSALKITMDKISEWLFDSGCSKLHLRGEEGTYYYARCTSVGVPTYNGLSARFTVSFTCDDYRKYLTTTEKPLNGADPSSDNFTFAGKHCLNDMGCIFVADKRPGIPAIEVSKYDVLGYAGTLRYDQSDFVMSEQVLTGKLYFVNRTKDGKVMFDSEIEERLHAVASWLVFAGRAPFVLDSDITRMYYAEVEDAAVFSRAQWENGQLDLSLTLQPYCVDVNATTMTQEISMSANTWSLIDLSSFFERGFGLTTPLSFEITNNGSGTVKELTFSYRNRLSVLRNSVLSGDDFSLAPGNTVTIDSDTGNVMSGSTDLQLCFTGDIPSISPVEGIMRVSIRSDVATTLSVKITARARWV